MLYQSQLGFGFGLCERSSSPACRGDWRPGLTGRPSAAFPAAHAKGVGNAAGSRCLPGLSGLLLPSPVLPSPLAPSTLAPSPLAPSALAPGSLAPGSLAPGSLAPLASRPPLPTSGRARIRCSRRAGAWREACTWLGVGLRLGLGIGLGIGIGLGLGLGLGLGIGIGIGIGLPGASRRYARSRWSVHRLGCVSAS